MKRTLLFASAITMICLSSSAFAQAPLFNGTFDANVDLWNASPFGTASNTIAWNSANDHTANSGGSLAATVPTASDDNSVTSAAVDGAVQFGGITTANSPAEVIISAYVFVDTPLVEAAGISGGNGGAAVALIDGVVDFTGTITADADRVLDNAAFELVSAPALTLQGGGHSYNAYLLVRNASGTAYFDDVTIVDAAAAIENWDIY